MPSEDDIPISDHVIVPGHEVWFEFSHASGPGGQNVNKVSTRATLCWSVPASSALTPDQKERVAARLSNRTGQDGVLRVSCSSHRSQVANREGAIARFADLVAGALERPKRRIPTRPTRASQERRIAGKKQRSRIRQDRGKLDW